MFSRKHARPTTAENHVVHNLPGKPGGRDAGALFGPGDLVSMARNLHIWSCFLQTTARGASLLLLFMPEAREGRAKVTGRFERLEPPSLYKL